MNVQVLSDNDKAKMLHALGPLIHRLERRKSLRLQYFSQSLTMNTIIQSLSCLMVRYVFSDCKYIGEIQSFNIAVIGKSISNDIQKVRWDYLKNEILQNSYWKGTIATLIRVWLLCDRCCCSINAALNIDPFPTRFEIEIPNTEHLRQSLNNNFSEGLNPYLQDKGFTIEDLYQMLQTIDQLHDIIEKR